MPLSIKCPRMKVNLLNKCPFQLNAPFEKTPPPPFLKRVNIIKCINKTASCNDETCPFDEMFGLKEDPPSQE